MNFKIGETFKIKDEELLVLDIIDGYPFVIALDTGIETQFSDENSNYEDSILRKATDDWFEELNVPAVCRYLDLTTMDGSKCYNFISNIKAAPLTFDEWRKYAKIIIPHIKNGFWLATAWADPKWKNWGSDFVCVVNRGGSANYNIYGYSGFGLAPAFILSKRFLVEDTKLSVYTTEELLQEIARRVN